MPGKRSFQDKSKKLKDQSFGGILDSFRLDAVRGAIEARSGAVQTVLRPSTGNSNKVMRQKFWQSSVLCTEAGQNGGRI